MDVKTLHTLEYQKVLERLASYCAFAASTEKAHKLQPTTNIDEAKRRLAETSEAVHMLVTRPDLTIGGARDIRQIVDLAGHGGVLTPPDLLDIKSTLIAARTLHRTFEHLGDQYPILFEIASQIPISLGIVDAITRAISERGEILDSASAALSAIRRDLRVAHDRLMTKLQRMVSDPHTSPYLQEALITQRDGRYVLPLRAEFKGRIKAVVHDQSASGATLFVEPLNVVEHNNAFRELQLAERDEERRILTGLSEQVGDQAINILNTVDRVAELDLCFAKAKYSDSLAASEPSLYPIGKSSGRHPGTVIRLYQARHPLLDPLTVVPIDVELDNLTYAMVVTGPNTGGKTVTLKTVGLLALMAQAGLHIPTNSGSEISIFHNIYADIGDEQSIEQSLSTFSGHITNIIRILDHADRRSLVILDELGAGTDPQEGAALARSLLTHLLERGITTLVTTHHPELKAFAHSTPGVVNASVEFDLETLQPTFHLTIGLPGRSNALAIAQRLGMPDQIITAARSELSPTDLKAEDLLDEIHRQRDLSRKARTAAENARHDAENLRAELSKRLEKIEDERMQVLDQARKEAAEELDAVQDELRDIRRQLARTRQPLQVIEEVEEKVEELQDEVVAPVERRKSEAAASTIHRTIRLGDKVRLHSLNTQGIVTSLGEEDAEVSVGVLRIRARLAELQLMNEESSSSPGKSSLPTARELIATNHSHLNKEINEKDARTTQSQLYTESPGIELDLRGQRSDEALDTLERYLDSAYLAGLPWVRIIHGKGTGKLRQAVRDFLSQNSHIKSFESGKDKEGGEGVTIARLAF
jgi:DNA mismatch repair protein MutS2